MGTSWKGALVLLVLGLTVPWYFTNSRRTDPKFPDSMDHKAILNTPLDHDSVIGVTRSLTRNTLSSLINQSNNFSWASRVSKQANVQDHNFTDESFFDFQMEHGDEGHETAGKGASLNQTSSTDGQFVLTPTAWKAKVQGKGFALVESPILEVEYSSVYREEYKMFCPKEVQLKFSDLTKKLFQASLDLTITLEYNSRWVLESNTITKVDQNKRVRHVHELGDRHIASVSMSLNIDYFKMKKKMTQSPYVLNDKMQGLLAALAGVEKSAVSVSISGSPGCKNPRWMQKVDAEGCKIKVDAEIQTPNAEAAEGIKTKLTGIQDVNTKVSNAVDSIPGEERYESGQITKTVRDFVTADSIVDSDSLSVTTVVATLDSAEKDQRFVAVSMTLNIALKITQQKMTQSLGRLQYRLEDKIRDVLAKQAEVVKWAVFVSISEDPSGSDSKVKVDAKITIGDRTASTIESRVSMSEVIALEVSNAVDSIPGEEVSESGDKTYRVRDFAKDVIVGSFEVTAEKVVATLEKSDQEKYAKLKELLEAGRLGMEVKARMPKHDKKAVQMSSYQSTFDPRKHTKFTSQKSLIKKLTVQKHHTYTLEWKENIKDSDVCANSGQTCYPKKRRSDACCEDTDSCQEVRKNVYKCQ